MILRGGRLIRLLLFCCATFGLISFFNGYPAEEREPESAYEIWQTAATVKTDGCEGFPAHIFEELQVVLRVGANQTLEDLLVHLSTVTACVPTSDILIFSDFDETIGRHHVCDALADFPGRRSHTSAMRRVYQQQEPLRDAEGHTLESHVSAETFDKYMLLPIVQKTWASRPGKKWYLFLEANTYIFFDNFLRWIAHFDHSEPLYMGSSTRSDHKSPYTNAGGAFVLSHAAIEKLNKNAKPGTHQFGLDMRAIDSGEEALGKVLKDRGIRPSGYSPMFSREKPGTIPFGEEHWCQPVITLRGLGARELNSLWQWEQVFRGSSALLFEDLYDYLQSYFNRKRENWDNLSENRSDGKSASTFEECENICEVDPACLQYSFHNGDCRLSGTFKLGIPVEVGDKSDSQFLSGWKIERIRQWRVAHSPCKQAQWVKAGG